MSNHSRKRAYSELSSSSSSDDTPGEEPEKLISDEDIIERLDLLDSATRRKLLIQAAQSHLDVLQAVKAKTNPLYKQARSSTLYFDNFANAVYKLTSCPSYKYDGGRLPEAFEAGQVDRVVSKISRYLKTIHKNSPQYASFATRQNALVTLVELCRDIFDANTPVAKEVIASFNEDFCPVGIMHDIVRGFTKDEIRLLKSRAAGKKWLLETAKLAEESHNSEFFYNLESLVLRVGHGRYNWKDEVRKQKLQKERRRLRKQSRISY